MSNVLQFKNFKAWVKIGEQRANCYATHIDKKRREASCWIASQEGKNFSVRFQKGHHRRFHCKVTTFIDGKEIGHCLYRNGDSRCCAFETLYTSETTVRPFMFAPLSVTDDESYIDNILLQESLKFLGEITIKVSRITQLRKSLQGSEFETTSDEEDEEDERVPNIPKVHESSNKVTAVPHQMAYGEEQDLLPPKHSDDDDAFTVYNERELLAILTFRYRPLDILLRHGIVPRCTILPPVAPRVIANSNLEGPRIPSSGRTQTQVAPSANNARETHQSLTLTKNDRTSNMKGEPDEEKFSPHDHGVRKNQVKDEPEEEKFSPNNHEAEEIDKEESLLLAQLERVRSRKRKLQEAANSARKSAKRENETKFYFKPGEVIDLT